MNEYKAPAFQYYPRDVLMNPWVAVMTLEEFGAYWTLMSYIWLEGSLPFNEKYLARLLRVTPEVFNALWPAMEKLFAVNDGNITSPELDEQRAKQAAWRLKSAEGGRKSGEVRRKGTSTTVEPPFKQNGSRVVEPKRKIASSSSSASATATPPPSPSQAPSDVVNDEGEGGAKNFGEQKNSSKQQSDSPSLSAKARRARQRTTQAAGGEGRGSRHPRATRREYADAHRLGDGWMTNSESGKYDDNVDEWLRDGKRVKGRGRTPVINEEEVFAHFDRMHDEQSEPPEDNDRASEGDAGGDDILGRVGELELGHDD